MFCIVGASLAGDTAAATLRAEGYDGRILLIGDEALPPYDRPPLSKEMLFEDMAPDRLFLRAESWYDEQGIELRLGNGASGIDVAAHRLTLRDGESIRYEKLLLTTGARARTLPVDAATGEVHVVRTLADSQRLRASLKPGTRVGIVGAGVIGLEVAASAVRLGCSVDVVDLADRVMSRVVPPYFSEYIAGQHRDRGVRLHLSAGEVRIEGSAIATGRLGRIEADLIVVGIGVVPNSELAQAAGIACDNGIIVDELARTGAPDIFAAGDVARYPCSYEGRLIRCENWRHAQDHAATAARNMLGHGLIYRAAPSMWSDQYDIKLQTCGRIGHGDPIVRGDAAGGRFMFLYRDASGGLAGAVGINQAKDMRFAQRLIEQGRAIDPGLLADPKQDLRKLAA
ncbi:NAD(P)/FAD-dependent oxidoreductase [Sphingosinicella terrae]|uniref:NAD(P)/FAD-dependent oxidoreductase n=1 Tax=Sphingosinicella terrae TaxID=2172047 RepID=UPI000E0D1591|nr:FAD-dependent oxidoreductase [Sphingosinicella terrae]